MHKGLDRLSSSSDSSSTTSAAPHGCAYCARPINSDYLKCEQCQGRVHIKCLRHASTPGDLLGDVFFDFTCCKCNDDVTLKFDGPSTSSSSNAPREKLSRQRLSWLMVITLTLYNLSLKSKGLSHHGYFHWRTHIVSFIDKNWDYLFDPTTRRRKKWIGSVSGALSHNSPEFFLSGQEVFHEPGWWKLTHSNQTPKFIFKVSEQQSLKRQQVRNDKRLLEESNNETIENHGSPEVEPKRVRRVDSDEETGMIPDSCSRTIPYMGRKPKVAKTLNIIDVDINKSLHQQQLQQQPEQEPQHSLNTVQSSLMDFLAENLASEDLMFQDLPNIAPEPIVSMGKNEDDLLQLIRDSSDAHNKNIENNFFDVSGIKREKNVTNGFDVSEDVDGKLKNLYFYQKHDDQQNALEHQLLPTLDNENDCISENISTISTNDSNNANEHTYHFCVDNEDDNDDDEEEYQPRIVQVTNFQQMPVQAKNISSKKMGKKIKKEPKSDTEQSGSEGNKPQKGKHGSKLQKDIENDDELSSSSEDEESNTLAPCKPSLFTKRTQQRNWPWLVQANNELNEGEDANLGPQESIVMMSEYEEQELLQKLRKIFSVETVCNIEIPSYVRRFYRKLCVRAWKREHSKPLFNLDDFCDPLREITATARDKNSKTQLIDRYQLISLSSHDARSSFYARIAGSFQYELFESPYTQRVLHPFIYRSVQCFPPWLKLMCGLQYVVNGTPPKRASIDYCYVRPNHIAAVNALLQTVFWPGIDMSDCLSYPDFSVVALYKKLVVGCGFLVPDVGYNEAYISFMAVRPGWQRSGIATFMLYHLIQTCMSKDITLHVSATNPAVVLYQKFGFKIEEVILDFYEKYLPLDSKHSRHAFFLRLMR